MGLFGFGKKKTKPEKVNYLLLDAIEQYEKKNYDLALPSFLVLAERGNAEAQFYCGQMFYYGLGMDKEDHKKGFDWYKKAAEQGHEKAQACLNEETDKAFQKTAETRYKNAVSGSETHDYDIELQYFLPQAEQGDAEAQFKCGKIYEDRANDISLHVFSGKSTAFDDQKQSASWYEKAAVQGHAHAQFYYGKTLEKEGHLKEAADWYKRAAEQADPALQDELYQYAFDCEAEYRLNGDAYHFTNVIYLYLAQRKHTNSLWECGKVYENHMNIYKQALYCYQTAARQGHAEAQCKCGEIYRSGWRKKDCSVEPSPELALHWYGKAAGNDWPEAQLIYADMLLNGEGTQPDKEAAIYWYEKAANDTDPYLKALLKCAELYLEDGLGHDMDRSKAKEYLENVAADGDLEEEGLSEKAQQLLKKYF